MGFSLGKQSFEIITDDDAITDLTVEEAGDIELNGVFANRTFTPHKISLSSSGTITVILTGINFAGHVFSETLDLEGFASQTTEGFYERVTKLEAVGGLILVDLQVGLSGIASSKWILPSPATDSYNPSLAVTLGTGANITYTLFHTHENILRIKKQAYSEAAHKVMRDFIESDVEKWINKLFAFRIGLTPESTGSFVVEYMS